MLLNNHYPSLKYFFLVFGYTGRTYIDNLTAIESPPNDTVLQPQANRGEDEEVKGGIQRFGHHIKLRNEYTQKEKEF